jgi:hypothetical protein
MPILPKSPQVADAFGQAACSWAAPRMIPRQDIRGAVVPDNLRKSARAFLNGASLASISANCRLRLSAMVMGRPKRENTPEVFKLMACPVSSGDNNT